MIFLLYQQFTHPLPVSFQMNIGLPLSSLCKSTAIQHFWKIPYHVVMTVCTLFKSHAYERALFKLAPLCCLGGSQYCSAAVSQLSQGSNYSFPDLYWRQHIFSMYCGIWSVCILHRSFCLTFQTSRLLVHYNSQAI